MANTFFNSNAALYLGGDDWTDHGSATVSNGVVAAQQGWYASQQIMLWMNTKLRAGQHDGTILAVGVTPGTYSNSGATGLINAVSITNGWSLRYAQDGTALRTELERIQQGIAKPPRIFYCAGTDSSGDWSSNASVRPVVAEYGALLRDWCANLRMGLYSHSDYNYNDWLPAFTDNSVVARFDSPNGSGNLRPTEFGGTQDYVKELTTSHTTVPWHNWFSTVKVDAEFSVLVESFDGYNNVLLGQDDDGANVIAPDGYHVPVGVSGFLGVGQTYTVDPNKVHFW